MSQSQLAAPIGEAIRGRVTLTDKAPADLADYSFATEAWELWKLLVQRRRFSTTYMKEFSPYEHDGAAGFIWAGSMREVIQGRFGRQGSDYFQVQVKRWLTDTGNAANLGTSGPGAKWWLRAEWNDVRPAKAHPPTPPAPSPSVAQQPAVAAVPATRPHLRSAVGAGSEGRPANCRWCTATYVAENARAGHERDAHWEKYLHAAEFRCTITVAGQVCDRPSHDRRGFGRHLSLGHGISRMEDRERLSAQAQVRARKIRAETPAPVTDTLASATVEPADDTAADTARRPSMSPAAMPAEPPASAAAAETDEPPAPAAAVPPLPVPAPLAADEAAPVPVADDGAAVTATDAESAIQTLLLYVRHFGPREAALIEQVTEEKAARAKAEAALDEVKLAGGLLELMTR